MSVITEVGEMNLAVEIVEDLVEETVVAMLPTGLGVSMITEVDEMNLAVEIVYDLVEETNVALSSCSQPCPLVQILGIHFWFN